jgi:hypothetical protein
VPHPVFGLEIQLGCLFEEQYAVLAQLQLCFRTLVFHCLIFGPIFSCLSTFISARSRPCCRNIILSSTALPMKVSAFLCHRPPVLQCMPCPRTLLGSSCAHMCRHELIRVKPVSCCIDMQHLFTHMNVCLDTSHRRSNDSFGAVEDCCRIGDDTCAGSPAEG